MQVDGKFNNPVNYLVSYIQGLLIFVLLIIVNCRFIFGRFIFNWDLFSWYFLMCYLLLPIENILFEKLRVTFKKNNRTKSLTHSSKNKPIHFSSTLKLSMYDNPNEDMTIRAYLLALEMDWGTASTIHNDSSHMDEEKVTMKKRSMLACRGLT